jgi:hypothetical protein
MITRFLLDRSAMRDMFVKHALRLYTNPGRSLQMKSSLLKKIYSFCGLSFLILFGEASQGAAVA